MRIFPRPKRKRKDFTTRDEDFKYAVRKKRAFRANHAFL